MIRVVQILSGETRAADYSNILCRNRQIRVPFVHGADANSSEKKFPIFGHEFMIQE